MCDVAGIFGEHMPIMYNLGLPVLLVTVLIVVNLYEVCILT